MKSKIAASCYCVYKSTDVGSFAACKHTSSVGDRIGASVSACFSFQAKYRDRKCFVVHVLTPLCSKRSRRKGAASPCVAPMKKEGSGTVVTVHSETKQVEDMSLLAKALDSFILLPLGIEGQNISRPTWGSNPRP